MAVTPVPTIGDVPPFPSLADRASYNSLAYTWAEYMRNIYPVDMKNLAQNVVANATDAFASAVSAANSESNTLLYKASAAQSVADAATYASQASVSSTAAIAAANFKGQWNSLTGTITRPACVSNNGLFYILLPASLVVTTVQPGVTANWENSWMQLPVNYPVTALTATSVTGTVGVRHLLVAGNLTLVVPTGTKDGDYFGFRNASGLVGQILDFGSQKLRGVAVGQVTIDGLYNELDLNWKNTTLGWV